MGDNVGCYHARPVDSRYGGRLRTGAPAGLCDGLSDEQGTHDLGIHRKLAKEAQAEYYEAQEKYARFADANQGLAMLSSRAELEKLQNEMNLAYSAYNQMSQQLRLAKAKVEEITPVYTIIQPASVPLRPSKPSKMMILVGCVFLAGVGSVGWVLFVRDFLRNRKKQVAGDGQKADD